MDFDIVIRDDGPFIVNLPSRMPIYSYELSFAFHNIPDMDVDDFAPGPFKKDVIACVRFENQLDFNNASFIYHVLRNALEEVLCNSLDAGATHMVARFYTDKPADTLAEAVMSVFKIALYDDGHGFIHLPLGTRQSFAGKLTFAEDKTCKIGGCGLGLRQIFEELEALENQSDFCGAYMSVGSLLDDTKTKRRGAHIILGTDRPVVVSKEEYNHITAITKTTPLSQAFVPSASPSPFELSPAFPSRAITPDAEEYKEEPAGSGVTLFRPLTPSVIDSELTYPVQTRHFG